MPASFNVVGREDNGNVIILWRGLEAAPLPKLIEHKPSK